VRQVVGQDHDPPVLLALSDWGRQLSSRFGPILPGQWINRAEASVPSPCAKHLRVILG